jgi:hypothetical protein
MIRQHNEFSNVAVYMLWRKGKAHDLYLSTNIWNL